MGRRQLSDDGQLTFLAPKDAALLELVRENLRLLAELRATYRSASPGARNVNWRSSLRCPWATGILPIVVDSFVQGEALAAVAVRPESQHRVGAPARDGALRLGDLHHVSRPGAGLYQPHQGSTLENHGLYAARRRALRPSPERPLR